MKDPALLFYPSDFLSGCMLMNMEQRGKYITLLCQQFLSGHLPAEDVELICGGFDNRVMSHFKKDENGCYYNERLEDEQNKRKAYSESRANNRRKKDTSFSNVDDVNNTSFSYQADMGNGNTNGNENINESANVKEKTAKFVPPTVSEVADYCRERNNNVDAERFVDYYTSNGWMVGKVKMKDWKSAVRTWEKKDGKKEVKQEEWQPPYDGYMGYPIELLR